MVVISGNAIETISNKALDFLAEQAKKIGGDALKSKVDAFKTDQASKHELNQAIERAAARFQKEYSDRDLALALTSNTQFYDLPSVRNAVRSLLSSPYDPAPRVTIDKTFRDVLSVADKDRAPEAASFFLDLLRQELMGVKKVQEVLNLVYQYEGVQALHRIEGLLTAKSPATEEAQRTYLNFLIERNTYLDPRGIMQTNRSITLKLDEVFISMTAEREIQASVRLLDDMERDEQKTVGMETTRELPERRLIETRQERVDLARAVRDNSRAVILGAPGAGKTTLTRFLSLLFAQAQLRGGTANVQDKDGNDYGSSQFPIIVRIADFADAYRKDKTVSLRHFLPKAFGDSGADSESLAALFEEKLAAGEALVLLDGMDEVIEASHRGQIARKIEDFVAGVHSGNRLVVTSRIAGYSSASLGGSFQHFTVQEMTRDQIAQFLQRWCMAAERFHISEAAQDEIERRAGLEINSILQAVDENEGVRRLATNPLMLTILALIHRPGARLPSRRVELYALATKTLLEDWQLERGIEECNIVQEPEAMQLLGPLAHWIHEHEPTGIISHTIACEKIAEILGKLENKEPDDLGIQTKVEDFLRRVREHTGIFVEMASGGYGFMHLTFEEYFTARELVRKRNLAAKRIYEHRHHPRWEEPILLAIGYESKDHPEDAADYIRNAILAEGEDAQNAGFEPSLYEDILHRDLLFAVRCISDCETPDSQLRQTLIEKLLILYFSRNLEFSYSHLKAQIIETFSVLKGAQITGETVAFILYRLQSEEEKDDAFRISAIEALGRLGYATPDVINTLLKAIADHSSNAHITAHEALGQLGHANPEVVNALLKAIADHNEIIRSTTAQALGHLGQANPEVIDALLKAIADHNENVRSSAIWALGQLGQTNPEVINTLLKASTDHNENVRSSAVWALGQLGQATPEVVNALLKAIADHNENVRRSAVWALGQLGQVNPEVINALLKASTDRNESICYNAIIALRKLGQVNPEVIDALIKAMVDPSVDVRSNMVWALGQLRQANPEVINALFKAIIDPNVDVRSSAAQALGQLGQASPEVIDALIKAIADYNGNVRNNTTWSLGQLGQATPEIVNTLLKASTDQEHNVRRSAIETLGKLGQATPEIVNALLKASTDQEHNVRSSAAWALGQIINRSIYSSVESMQKIAETLHQKAIPHQSTQRNFVFIRNEVYYGEEDVAWEALSIVCDRLTRDAQLPGKKSR